MTRVSDGGRDGYPGLCLKGPVFVKLIIEEVLGCPLHFTPIIAGQVRWPVVQAQTNSDSSMINTKVSSESRDMPTSYIDAQCYTSTRNFLHVKLISRGDPFFNKPTASALGMYNWLLCWMCVPNAVTVGLLKNGSLQDINF